MAGSGILYPAASWKERLEKVADLYFRLGVRQVTSHDGCGAAGIAFRRDGGTEKFGGTPDEYGQKWARELQAALCKKSGREDISSVNISADEMKRPSEFHNARAVWFDATGKFNPAKLGDEIPMGFVIDYGRAMEFGRSREERDYPFAELAVALNIAFGRNGFGEKFTATSPLLIVVLAENAAMLETARKWVEQKIPDNKKELVKIDGYARR